jgi:hypothetical protein
LSGVALVLCYLWFLLVAEEDEDHASSALLTVVSSSGGNSARQRFRDIKEEPWGKARFYKKKKKESLKYVIQISSFERTLLFVHIPKTAGTTIELSVARDQAAMTWGMCMFREENLGVTCPPKEYYGPAHSTVTRRPPFRIPFGEWHVPPHFWPLAAPKQGRTRGYYHDPYQAAELFVVVRDPIERQVSDYFYFCQTVLENKVPCSAAGLNQFLLMRLSKKTTRIRDYISEGCHWIPQYDYVVRPGRVRQVDYVLNVESLREQFDALATAYRLPLHLPAAAKENVGQYDLSTSNIHPFILEKLRLYTAKDVSLLGG